MKILAVGAHPDDIEFGCYGTLSHYADLKNSIHFILLSSGEKLAGKGSHRKRKTNRCRN